MSLEEFVLAGVAALLSFIFHTFVKKGRKKELYEHALPKILQTPEIHKPGDVYMEELPPPNFRMILGCLVDADYVEEEEPKPTPKQLKVISYIEQNLDIEFPGTTLLEAQAWISAYMGESKRAFAQKYAKKYESSIGASTLISSTVDEDDDNFGFRPY